MLKITIPKCEIWDEANNCFILTKEQELCLEHSLVSLSKWESKHHKYFLENKTINPEEMLDYIRCMTLTKNVEPEVYNALTQQNINDIVNYINDSMTATFFSDNGQKKTSKEIITSEIIYYWMISLQIPVEFQKWHLNRLLTLIKVCNEKNTPEKDKKKMTKREIMERNKMLNEQRRKITHSKG